MIRLKILLLILSPLSLAAQFNYVESRAVTVRNAAGEILSNAWAGGLNAGQYNTMDLNNDGKQDLVVFDRMANKVSTFINADGRWQYEPDYEKTFPSEVTRFLLLKDYDCDGKKDLFTGDALGIKVYRNVTSGPVPSWEQFFFYTGSAQKRPVIMTKGFQITNLQIQPDDLPSFVDADGDGDLDIFNMRYPTGSTIEFHKNFSKERFGTCDSLVFERMTQQWGNVTECSCGVFAFDGTSCSGGGRTKHQGGKSLLISDFNNDNLLDIVLSEAECSNLYLLENTGTTDQPSFATAATFPMNQAVNLNVFPAAYLEDVDFDGVKDLIAAPNLYVKESPLVNLQASSWLYTNTGSDEQPNYELVTQAFLQEQMIEVGDNAIPAFADLDGDFDPDMLISNNAFDGLGARIFVFENIGSPANPEFQSSVDLDFSVGALFNVKPHIVDIDRDGKQDFVFTATNPETNVTQPYYIRNTQNTGISLNTIEAKPITFPMTAADNLHFVDINLDGFPDILAGRSNGALEFWVHTGSSIPGFTLEEPMFLEPEVNDLSQYVAASTGDLNADGKTDLVLGDQSGRVRIISNFREESNRASKASEIIFNELSGSFEWRNLGGRIWPVVARLFETDRPQIVVGTTQGGLKLLKHQDGDISTDKLYASVFPNYVTDGENIKVSVNRSARMEMFNATGSRVLNGISIQAGEMFIFSADAFSPGLYFLRIHSSAGSVTKRLIRY